MPFDKESPYDLLNATPDDNDAVLQQRWGKAMGENRRDSAMTKRIADAFQKLKDPVTRLSYDILFISDPSEQLDLGDLKAALAQPELISPQLELPPVTLAMTGLAGGLEEFFQDLARPDQAFSGALSIEPPQPAPPAIHFDR